MGGLLGRLSLGDPIPETLASLVKVEGKVTKKKPALGAKES